MLLCCPDAGPDPSSASVPVPASAEDDQHQDEEEHTRYPDARAWIPAHVSMD
jgi:hypothetical protein